MNVNDGDLMDMIQKADMEIDTIRIYNGEQGHASGPDT